MKRHFLIDASALVLLFLKTTEEESKGRAAIAKLLDLREKENVVLFVPNFCMAECSKVLAKNIFGQFKDHEKARTEYDRRIERLLDVVSRSGKGLIQSYDLKRDHLVGIEAVFKAEYGLASERNNNPLSGLDALIVAMGMELGKKVGLDKTHIVTQDEWLAKVCNSYRDQFPRAIYVLKDPIPDGI